MFNQKKNNKNLIHFDTLNRELTETLALSFGFKGIEALGKDLFYNNYRTHELEKIDPEVTISSHQAATRLVHECDKVGRINDLISYIMQLEGNYLNGKVVNIFEFDTFLFHLSKNGYVYDEEQKKFISKKNQNKYQTNWGALKDGGTYELVVASIDICENSKLVSAYGAKNMEGVYNQLHNFLKDIIHEFEGRIWSWQGDGGLIAFRGSKKIENSINCAIKIQLNLPFFNLSSKVNLNETINLRIALDCGNIKFFNDVGRIVSETINYAAHLEKKGTLPAGISISEKVYSHLPKKVKAFFKNEQIFENRKAYSLNFDFKSCFGLNSHLKV